MSLARQRYISGRRRVSAVHSHNFSRRRHKHSLALQRIEKSKTFASRSTAFYAQAIQFRHLRTVSPPEAIMSAEMTCYRCCSLRGWPASQTFIRTNAACTDNKIPAMQMRQDPSIIAITSPLPLHKMASLTCSLFLLVSYASSTTLTSLNTSFRHQRSHRTTVAVPRSSNIILEGR